MRFQNICISIITLSTLSLAVDAPKPQSRLAREAIAKADRAHLAADADASKAKAMATQQLVVELRTALKSALATESLDEANAMKAAMNAAEAEAKTAGTISEKNGGTKWAYGKSDTVLIYTAQGEVKATYWKRPLRWERINNRTIRQQDPSNIGVTITFADDWKHALWVFDDGGLEFLKHIE